MNEMTMPRRLQRDLDEVLQRDAADRAGQERELLSAVQKTELAGRQTPEHSVVFCFADGPVEAFDGTRWERWCASSRRKA